MLTREMLTRLHSARERLAEMGESSLPLAKIAQEANLSPSRFIRRFTAVFGETPHQFRIRVRLERAKEMLVLGEGSVTEICMSVGFSSLGSFSWLFSQRYGESPSSYRRRLFPSLEMPGRLPPHLIPGCISLMVSAWETAQFSRSISAEDLPESVSSTFEGGVRCESN